jgi:hypothetical protein
MRLSVVRGWLAPLACLLAALGCGTPMSATRTAPARISLDMLQCRRADDCIITGDGGCCSCPVEPFAVSVRYLQGDGCENLECMKPAPAECDRVRDSSQFRAVCASGICERRPQ